MSTFFNTVGAVFIVIPLAIAMYTVVPLSFYVAAFVVKGSGLGLTTIWVVGASVVTLIINSIVAQESPSFFTWYFTPLVLLSWPVYAIGVFYHYGDELLSLGTPQYLPTPSSSVTVMKPEPIFTEDVEQIRAAYALGPHRMPFDVYLFIAGLYADFYKCEPRPAIETIPDLPPEPDTWMFLFHYDKWVYARAQRVHAQEQRKKKQAEIDAAKTRQNSFDKVIDFYANAAVSTIEVIDEALTDIPEQSFLRVPLHDALRNANKTMSLCLDPFISQAFRELQLKGIFGEHGYGLYATFLQNRDRFSREVLPITRTNNGEVMRLTDYTGSPQSAVESYFINTPFHELFKCEVPLGIPDHLRPEHGVIVARSGGGKSQLLEGMIAEDLDRDDPPAIVVIDSKRGPRSLLERIAHLDVFHPDTGKHRERLIIIDSNDKPALNLFQVRPELIETRMNEIASMMRYFLRDLFGHELSNQMDVLFLPLLHIVVRIPGATLYDFMDVIGNPFEHQDIIDQLPRGVKRFLMKEYNNKDNNFQATKSAIRVRLSQIMNQETLDDMFSAPRNSVNFAEAFRTGKTILIATDEDSLGEELSRILGKFFISRIVNAGLELGSLETPHRVHLYFDECGPYVDDQLGRIFRTLRSYGVGAMVAFQEVEHMKSQTSTIITNTAIKFMGSTSVSDAKAFAADMNAEPEFIRSHNVDPGKRPTKTRFAYYNSDLGRAVSVTVPIGALDPRQMDKRAYDRLRVRNKVKVSILGPAPEPAPQSDDFTGTTIDGKAVKPPPAPIIYLPGPETKRQQGPLPGDFDDDR